MKTKPITTALGWAMLLALLLLPVVRGQGTSAENPRPRPPVKSPQQEAADKAAAFMAAIAAKPGVIKTSSGLCYEIQDPGTGPVPKPTDIVKAHYTGTLITGTVFETSRKRPEPVEFPLNRVIAGWTEGLQKIAKGGKIRLYVPPNLAYGEQRRRGIPAGSALIFEVEIIDIRDAP